MSTPDYPDPPGDTWREIHVNIFRVEAEHGRPRLRLYCTMSNPRCEPSWSLQVRGPVTKRKGDGGRRDVHIVADASLKLEDMIALRDILDDQILTAVKRKASFDKGVPWDIIGMKRRTTS